MLQAHSILWHYLWLAPNLLQLVLAAFLARRGFHREFPIFTLYLAAGGIEDLVLYAMDILPAVTWQAYWTASCVGLVIFALFKILVFGELFSHLVRSWPSIAKLGNRLISAVGALLLLLATVAAAYAPIENPQHAIISREHILEQSVYIIQSGIILFLFLFAAYFRLRLGQRIFGTLLGFGVLSCQHLAAWAITANGLMFNHRYLLDFFDMASYHICILIWFYYLLVPEKAAISSQVRLPGHNLEIWNQELERLLHP
ncbi:MAG TPA: hypothetical protein VFO39_23190 [Candidatus Sulfotelmatobacter sp.]|nr:hypothetical protein [Candidatus Sulfotelmatobacter sp.]